MLRFRRAVSSSAPDASRGILNSWKEIACYLDRGVRTVQRWEVDLHLPVRRLRSERRGPVFALKSEIDLWLKQRPREKRNGDSPRQSDALGSLSRDLQLKSQQLRLELKQSRDECESLLSRLCVNLRKMSATPPVK